MSDLNRDCLCSCYFVHHAVLHLNGQVLIAYLVFSSVQHILGNLLMQLVVGIALELVHKGFEVGMVYLSGVLAGENYLFSVFHLTASKLRTTCWWNTERG